MMCYSRDSFYRVKELYYTAARWRCVLLGLPCVRSAFGTRAGIAVPPSVRIGSIALGGIQTPDQIACHSCGNGVGRHV